MSSNLPFSSYVLANASPSLPSAIRDRNHLLHALVLLICCVGKRKAEQRNR